MTRTQRASLSMFIMEVFSLKDSPILAHASSQRAWTWAIVG